APGASVFSFTSGSISITDPQNIVPFPGLEQTHNTVIVSYSEPDQVWKSEPAPAKTSDKYTLEDGGRKLTANVNLPLVHDNDQAQRIAYTLLEDGRRFRIFKGTFHPATWVLEPGDVIDGTIVSEGYINKEFEILEMSGRRNFMQTITLREIDPDDFDPPESA